MLNLIQLGPARFWRPCGQTNLLFMTLTSKTVMQNPEKRVQGRLVSASILLTVNLH
jgi:hypothetical protein